MKSFSITNYIILFIILIVLGLLYRRFENKRVSDENLNNYLNRRESIVFLKKFIMQIEPSFKEIGEKKSTISEADKIKFTKN